MSFLVAPKPFPLTLTVGSFRSVRVERKESAREREKFGAIFA